MKLFCISTGVWIEKNVEVNRLLARSIDSMDEGTLLYIDMATIKRESDFNEILKISLVVVDLHEWVSSELIEGGVVDVHAIRRFTLGLNPADVLVIKANGYLFDPICRVLSHLRLGFYASEFWPSAVLIVVDEPIQYKVAQELSTAFYIRPQVKNIAVTNKISKKIYRRASLLRIFGVKLGLLSNLYKSISASVDGAFDPEK